MWEASEPLIAERALGPVVLTIDDLTVSYGGLRAVDHVNVNVHGGEIVGLIGPNGAGKTTLLDAISGFVPYSGSITVTGTTIDHLAPHARARSGLGRSWQSADLFRDLTIRENLIVASEPAAGLSVLLDALRPGSPPGSNLQIDDTLAQLSLTNAADRLPGELSLGRQKLVSVARALVSSPAVILLDEPVAGLDDRISRRLLSDIRKIADTGTGVLVIDHDTDFMFEVCDRVLVLDFGRVIAEGPGRTVRHDPAVVAAYLGEAAVPPRWQEATSQDREDLP
jgi:branched-chain amino acid transport system ATP-binding protein